MYDCKITQVIDILNMEKDMWPHC